MRVRVIPQPAKVRQHRGRPSHRMMERETHPRPTSHTPFRPLWRRCGAKGPNAPALVWDVNAVDGRRGPGHLGRIQDPEVAQARPARVVGALAPKQE